MSFSIPSLSKAAASVTKSKPAMAIGAVLTPEEELLHSFRAPSMSRDSSSSSMAPPTTASANGTLSNGIPQTPPLTMSPPTPHVANSNRAQIEDGDTSMVDPPLFQDVNSSFPGPLIGSPSMYNSRQLPPIDRYTETSPRLAPITSTSANPNRLETLEPPVTSSGSSPLASSQSPPPFDVRPTLHRPWEAAATSTAWSRMISNPRGWFESESQILHQYRAPFARIVPSPRALPTPESLPSSSLGLPTPRRRTRNPAPARVSVSESRSSETRPQREKKRSRAREDDDGEAPVQKKRAAPKLKPRYNHPDEIPDYCPPLALFDQLPAGWKAPDPEKKFGTELVLETSESASMVHLLHPLERPWASSLRLDPAKYLINKRLLFRAFMEYLDVHANSFTKTHAQTACSIDVNKASALYNFYTTAGMLDESKLKAQFAKYRADKAKQKAEVIEAESTPVQSIEA